MNQKRAGKVMAAAMSVMMMAGLVVAPVYAAGNDPVEVTTANGSIQIDASSVTGASLEGRAYGIFKVMDKYSVGVDGAGNAIYHYGLTDEFEGFTSEKFAIDSATGKITTKVALTVNGTAIPAGTVVDASYTDLSNTNAALVSILARELSVYAYAQNITPTAKSQNGATAGDLVHGWYLVMEIGKGTNSDKGIVATKPILLNVGEDAAHSDVVATMKDAGVTLDKTFKADGGTADVKSDNFDIGDTIAYTIASQFPVYAADVTADGVKFNIVDTLSAGLTLKEDTLKIYVDSVEIPAATLARSVNGQVITINVPGAYVLANQGKSIVVTYDAVLNENAVYNTAAAATNNNQVVLTYSNNPSVQSAGVPGTPDIPGSNGDNELTDETKVYTYAVDMNKMDGAHNSLLAGATFQLKKGNAALSLVKTANTAVDEYRPALATDDAANVVTSFVTTDKEVRFIGLDAGDYALAETAAPAGYSKLSGDLAFTITEGKTEGVLDGTATVSASTDLITLKNDDTNAAAGQIKAEGASNVNLVVKNYEGITLPGTGSVASIIVMGAGAAVVIGGGLYFVLRKKKDSEVEE